MRRATTPATPLLLLLGAATFSGACTGVPGVGQQIGASYHFESVNGEFDGAGPSADTDITGYELTYEFLPFASNNNLALTYRHREDELQAGGGEVESDLVRAQLRWNYVLIGPVHWYIGPGLGYAFAVDGPAGADYGGSLYYDLEAGARWKVYDQFGVQGLVNWGVLNASGDGATPDADLTGVSFAGGVFWDF